MVVEPADKEKWDEWFDNQYEICDRIKRAIDGLSKGKEGKARDQFRAAIWSSIIETSAEELRSDLNLDGWKKEEAEVKDADVAQT